MLSTSDVKVSLINLFLVQVVKKFLKKSGDGVLDTGWYMQVKLPLNSATLQALSAVDPLAWGHSSLQHRFFLGECGR